MPVGIPPWPPGKPYDAAPTFEVLQQRSGFKVAKLREKLLGVPRFKCKDNSVRYDDAAATAALEGADPMGDELDDAASSAVAEPLPADPVQAALQVMNRTLSLFSVVVRERGEVVRLCCDTIKTMGEPQKLGQELVRETVGVLQARLTHYDAMWDRMVLLVEDLQSTQAERARGEQQQGERQQMRRETFELAKQYLPTALDRFALTVEAQTAIDVLGSIDPDYLEPMLELGVVPEPLVPKARKLIEMLKARKRAPAKGGPSNGAATTPDET